MSANTAHTDSCPVCVLIRRYSYLTLCGMRVNEWPASKICNFPPHPVTPLISNSKVRFSLTNMFYVPILDTCAGCLAPRPILQICATTQSTWSLSIYSLVACCLDLFSIPINGPLRSSLVTAFVESVRRECNGHFQSLHSSLLEVLLLARCIAALSTLISYVASGPELIASCVIRFSLTASSLAPSLAFPCSHLTSLCLSVRVYVFPSLQDGYSVRPILTRSFHISFSMLAGTHCAAEAKRWTHGPPYRAHRPFLCWIGTVTL